jgi:hypothetical protein
MDKTTTMENIKLNRYKSNRMAKYIMEDTLMDKLMGDIPDFDNPLSRDYAPKMAGDGPRHISECHPQEATPSNLVRNDFKGS